MALLIAIHKTPHDPAAYNQHYFDKHVPLAKNLPGLRKFEVSHGPVTRADGVHLVAVLHFDDAASAEAALSSDAGKAALDDLPKFAEDGNIELIIIDTHEL